MSQAVEAREHARQQARAHLQSIVELMTAIESARLGGLVLYADEWLSFDELEERAHELPLSVLVRSAWSEPGSELQQVEYEILLCTGGPAVRIRGDLSEHCEPTSARLEAQDWFVPWEAQPTTTDEDWALVEFALLFWFGG